MKPLIVFYSFTNNNRQLANVLADQVQADIIEIVEKKHRSGFIILLDTLFSRNPEIQFSEQVLRSAENVIIIWPVWFGQIASPMKSFLKHAATLTQKNYSLITLCGAAVKGQEQKLKEDLF